MDWAYYNKDDLNGFLNQVIQSSDDFARWNAFLFFRESNDGEAFLQNARDFLAQEGWEPDTKTSLRIGVRGSAKLRQPTGRGTVQPLRRASAREDSVMRLDTNLTARLVRLGFDAQQIETLVRSERALHRWAERECNGDIQAVEDDAGNITGYVDQRGNRVRDLETPALERAREVAATRGLLIYHQTDPRGCSLYVYSKDDLATYAERVGAEHADIRACYSGVAVSVCA